MYPDISKIEGQNISATCPAGWSLSSLNNLNLETISGLSNINGDGNYYLALTDKTFSSYLTRVVLIKFFRQNGKWISLNPWTVEPTGSNVLFLPGILASDLYTTQTNGSENKLWFPLGNSDVEKLYLNSNGSSINPNIYTKNIVNKAFGLSNIYQSFSDTMDKLVTDEKITEWKAFPYDWRQSADDVVNKPVNLGNGQSIDLVSELKVLIKSSKNGKVTIVAHSNGGLVAKYLLAKLQDMKAANPSDDMIDHIDMLIMVATPQIGTAGAVPGILHGFDQEILGGWLLDDLHARELGRNMPAAYGLLPSKEYINEVSASPVAFVDNPAPSGVTTSFVKVYGNVIDSYGEYKSFLFGSEGRAQPAVDDEISPIDLSPTLFGQAENLHNKIDVWTPPAGLKVVEVAGWGLDTVASFQYYPKYECDNATTGIVSCKNILDEKPIFTSDGDKVVVEPSAMYMNANKVWVDLTKTKEEHKNILEIPQLENFISSLIENQTPTYDSVLTQAEPIETSNRLHISIHSPATISAHDKNGNFTGKICPDTSDFCYAQEDIPNSSYVEFGEGKYLNLSQDSLQSVTLQGTDTGTFTLDMQTVTPNGQSTTQSFVDIPVTTQTQADITVDQTTGAPQLALDVTGDGKTDFTLTPSATFDPVLFLQIMRQTVNSFDINKITKTLLLLRIDDTIKAIQKSKISKAKLDVKQFEKSLSVQSKVMSFLDKIKWFKKITKPKIMTQDDMQTLLTMLNQLLNNLNQ